MAIPLVLFFAMMSVGFADDDAQIFLQGDDLVLNAASGNIIMRYRSGNESTLIDVVAQLESLQSQLSSTQSKSLVLFDHLKRFTQCQSKAMAYNMTSDMCTPVRKSPDQVQIGQQAGSILSSSSKLLDKVGRLRSQINATQSLLQTFQTNLTSTTTKLQSFIECQRQGMSYNVTLDQCMPMVPQCAREGEILVWNPGENRYRCSSFLIDFVNTVQTELKLLQTNQTGDTAETAGVTCRDISERRGNVPSGVYWIEPTGSGNSTNAFQVYCDMLTDGGGWTLVSVVKAFRSTYVKKYPVNGMNENKLLADRTDDWASLSQTRLNQIHNANKDTIMRVYVSAFKSLHTGDRSYAPRTYYIKKLKNDRLTFNAFHSIRYVPEWGNKATRDYKLNYYRQGLIHPYDHTTHDFMDGAKTMHHWENHAVVVDSIPYTTSRHGIVGDAFSNCEWLFQFGVGSGLTALNCRRDSSVYSKIWLK